MQITPKDWKKFQHYARRNPPWIKLHKSTLDDYKFGCLHDASKVLAFCLWLLASEYINGCIECGLQQLIYRLRIDEKKFFIALKELESQGFMIVEWDNASTMLARCYYDATPETETETETETEKEEAGQNTCDVPLKRSRPTRTKKVLDDEEWMQSLKEASAYKHINVEAEFSKMIIWCQNKKKQPTRSRFINWLNRIEKPMNLPQVANHRDIERQRILEANKQACREFAGV